MTSSATKKRVFKPILYFILPKNSNLGAATFIYSILNNCKKIRKTVVKNLSFRKPSIVYSTIFIKMCQKFFFLNLVCLPFLWKKSKEKTFFCENFPLEIGRFVSKWKNHKRFNRWFNSSYSNSLPGTIREYLWRWKKVLFIKTYFFCSEALIVHFLEEKLERHLKTRFFIQFGAVSSFELLKLAD